MVKDISNSRLFLLLMIGISLVSPGVAVIYMLNKPLFVSLSTGKLVLLAMAISTPVFFIQVITGMVAAVDIFGEFQKKNSTSEIENHNIELENKERMHYTSLIMASMLTCICFYLALYFNLSVKKYFSNFWTSLGVSVVTVTVSMIYLIRKESQNLNKATPKVKKLKKKS